MSAWRELKAKGDSDDVKLSPIELAIYNLWYETMGFEPEAERAANELADLRAQLEAEEARGDLHFNLNRRTAEVLGKPLSGYGSTWHDIPEKVAELRKAVKDARRQLLKARSIFGATFEPRDLRMAEKYINAALEALEPG